MEHRTAGSCDLILGDDIVVLALFIFISTGFYCIYLGGSLLKHIFKFKVLVYKTELEEITSLPALFENTWKHVVSTSTLMQAELRKLSDLNELPKHITMDLK